MSKHGDANFFVLVIQRKSPRSRPDQSCNHPHRRRQIALNLSNVMQQHTRNILARCTWEQGRKSLRNFQAVSLVGIAELTPQFEFTYRER
jgi:hypothetical protein